MFGLSPEELSLMSTAMAGMGIIASAFAFHDKLWLGLLGITAFTLGGAANLEAYFTYLALLG